MDFKAFEEKVQSDGAFAAQFQGKKPSEVVDQKFVQVASRLHPGNCPNNPLNIERMEFF